MTAKPLEQMTEPELTEQMNRTCRAVKASLPDGTGFIILAASFGGRIAQYAGNVERETAIPWIHEMLQRWGEAIPRVGR